MKYPILVLFNITLTHLIKLNSWSINISQEYPGEINDGTE